METSETKISILILDDHRLIRDTWNFILDLDPRFKVVANCCNGEEALLLAQQLNPQIILLDLIMAPMNGFEFLDELNKTGLNSKVIILSSNENVTDVVKIMLQGASGFVTKNIRPDQMFDVIIEVNNGKKHIDSEVKQRLANEYAAYEKEFEIPLTLLKEFGVEIAKQN